MSAVQPVRLVTVIGPSSRGDFAVAADAYPADIAEVLAGLLGEPEGSWALAQEDGTPLGITGSLATKGVRDGDALLLLPSADVAQARTRPREEPS